MSHGLLTSPAPVGVPSPKPRPVHDYGRVLVGLLVVVVGVLYLLQAAGVLDADQAIHDWWPLAVIGLGVTQLLERGHALFWPLLFISSGIVFLLFTTDLVEGDPWSYVWPLAVIAAGLAVLSRWRGVGALPADASYEDTVVATGVFGGPAVASASQQFRGASLTAVFGGVTLDLRHARPAPEGAAISATAVFGGIEVLVPHGWRITTDSTPLFGGVEDKTATEAEPLADDAPRLHVDALALFGGVEIKHDKHDKKD